MATSPLHGSQEVVIASGTTTSGVIDSTGHKVMAIMFPTMTGATVTFTACDTPDGTFLPVYDDAGSQYSVTATDNACVAIDAAALALAPVRYFKIVSASSEGADRTLKILYKT